MNVFTLNFICTRTKPCILCSHLLLITLKYESIFENFLTKKHVLINMYC